MKQCQEIKQNWTERESFEICFCVVFDQLHQSFISGKLRQLAYNVFVLYIMYHFTLW